VNTGANRGIKKRCPACGLEFVGTLVVCTHDGVLLVPVKETLVGQVLANKYEVLGEIGRGGMSVVYKGRDTFIDRLVAIKMLQAQLVSDQTSLLRFQREAQAVACIQHPNVVAIYASEIHDGQPYLVMDYLVGESLSDIIKRENHISVERVLKMFIRVTDALEHAHQKGVLHRDLKSSNVMLVKGEDGSENVKVVDFGIAKLLPSSGKQAQNLTATGEIFGSPIYMSPEQCQGLPLDKRSDIYSAGVMMYEALTGEPPLLGENIVDTMQMHVTTQPVPFAEIRPDLYIPPSLEAIVLKTLEKNPAARFESMLEFKKALEHLDKNMTDRGPDPLAAPRPGTQRATRTTRQGMTGSRAPSSMPKPILDSAEGRMSSSRNPRSDGRQSSAKIPDLKQSSARHQIGAKKREADASLTSFNVGDLQQFDQTKKKRRTLLLVSIIIIVIALLALVAFFVFQHIGH
jgi:serine/threonine protein kinase